MYKTRPLQFDYGDDLPNHMYSSTSSVGNSYTMDSRQWDVGNTQLELYNRYKALANTVFSSSFGSTGKETMYSSEYKRPVFNSCDHSRVRGINALFGHFFTRDYSSYYARYCWRRQPSFVPETLVSLKKHFSVDIDAAQRAAYWNMQPRFEGNVSMFNFILEMRDFKSLAKLAFKGDTALRLSRFFKWKNIKRMLSDNADDMSKTLSEVRLVNEFAIKPLISDIAQIAIDLNVVVSEAQKSFADAGLGRNKMHYSEFFPVSESSSWSDYYANRNPERFEGFIEDFKFTATTEFSYKYSARTPLDAFMRYWGLVPTADVIWNFIPFSFLVDYVLTVGKSIKAMSLDDNVDFELMQYCESMLSRQMSGSFLTPAGLAGGTLIKNGKIISPSGNTLIAGNESTLFTRIVTDPNKGAVLPRFKTPNSNQALNAAAILRCFF